MSSRSTPSEARQAAVIVLDIGKTHVKLFAIDPDGRGVLDSRQTASRSVDDEPYLHVDVEHIWTWFLETLGDLASPFDVQAIIPCAYGSTAGLIDDDGLVLPMMDYEAEPPAEIAEAYAEIAPAFDESYCPVNPSGLTLARQLFWQNQAFSKAFRRARWILPAAQYWAWRLSGKVATEVTSLGAQTQLWNPDVKTVTELAKSQRWASRFPPLRKAYETLGPLDAASARAAGLDQCPPILVGIHDSNANYARYLAAGLERFTLISSGTWLITFDTALPLDRLDSARDMVANTDLEGRPVACTRFMGGREFSEVAGPEGLAARSDLADVQKIIEQGTMALPSFTDSGGPFPGTGNKGRIEGPEPVTPAEKSALATLYTALVTDTDLDLLASDGDIIIDGSFAENPHYPSLLSALRPTQTVTVSRDHDGTALGAALLWNWQTRTGIEPVRLDLEPVSPLELDRLADYKTRWRSRVGQG